jgi:formylglycine-generating enzyme required for sulfatase activity
MAFCAWLGKGLSRKLDSEVSVTLPTEWQWERAARGTKGRVYPWTDEDKYEPGRANIDETGGDVGPHRIGRTTAVGIYLHGASPEGVMDLSGNVWEWCLNEYEDPERIQKGGTRSRVLRGGSWLCDRGYARAVFRYHDLPFDRSGDLGFRLVCSSPIADR